MLSFLVFASRAAGTASAGAADFPVLPAAFPVGVVGALSAATDGAAERSRSAPSASAMATPVACAKSSQFDASMVRCCAGWLSFTATRRELAGEADADSLLMGTTSSFTNQRFAELRPTLATKPKGAAFSSWVPKASSTRHRTASRSGQPAGASQTNVAPLAVPARENSSPKIAVAATHDGILGRTRCIDGTT